MIGYDSDPDDSFVAAMIGCDPAWLRADYDVSLHKIYVC